ncbi:MAG: hypothetical protein ACE5H0_05425 [Bacteroidota bacterium]
MNLFRMEKILITVALTGLVLIPWQITHAQCAVNLQVVPLRAVNLGDLIVADEIRNTTVYATLFIGTDVPRQVRIKGNIDVKLPTYGDFRPAGTFTTAPFKVDPPGRTILNTDFGDFPGGISVEGEGDSEILDDVRRIGRPAGSIRFIFIVIDEATQTECGRGEHVEEITNPVQILRTGPADGSQQGEENTVFTWTGDAGFESYLLEVNVQEQGQTPEVALDSNQPPIFNESVGIATSVNLRDLTLQRQILPGMRIVWRVRGVVPGVGEELEIPTDIGRFSILDPNSALITAVVNELRLLTQQLGLGDFASQLLSGVVTLTGEFVFADGTRVSYEELLNILNYLKANPDKVINVRFE